MPAILLFVALISMWQIVCDLQLVPNYMLPSPLRIFDNFIAGANTYMQHTAITLYETLFGLILGIILGVSSAALMDLCQELRSALLPLLSITQTIPIIAIAPILVMLFGLGSFPKILLVACMTFFPIAIATLGGLLAVPRETIDISTSIGASRIKTLLFVKVPSSLHDFFSALKISVTYAFSAAVIGEWLGGSGGIGVVMVRFKKSFDYTSMFSCVLIIVVVTLILVLIVNLLERKICKWRYLERT